MKQRRNPETKLMKQMEVDGSKRWNGVGVIYRINAGKGTPPRASRPIQFAPPGWPDLVLLLRGRMVGVEVKTEDGTPKDSQRAMAKIWWANGTPYIFARSSKEMFALVEQVLGPELAAPASKEEIAAWKEIFDRDSMEFGVGMELPRAPLTQHP